MNIVLVIIIAILTFVIIIQYRGKLNRNKDMEYIVDKLQEIIHSESSEKIKVFTGDREIKRLLVNINNLIDYNEKNLIKYKKTKMSMKKMLSNISHDLKTPLTVLLGYIEILKLKGEEKIMSEKIHLKATEVLEIINEFFDLAKLEAGDKNIAIGKVDISEICRKSILAFYDTLDKNEIKTEIVIPENNIYVLGNEEAINRILDNLISNGIKYGKDGRYLGFIIEDDEDKVIIKVIDKGKGIEDKYKEEVFERSYTLEDSRSKAYRGSGLGLTITKTLIETLGGEIHLESIPNKKTVFSFTLNKLNY